MNAQEVLNILLSNNCYNPAKYAGFNEYAFDGCCSSYKIIARPVGEYDDDKGYTEFEVKSIEVK